MPVEQLIKSYPPEYTPEDIQRLVWAEIGKWLNLELIKKIRQNAQVSDEKTEK